jgi:hypothetical protein
MWQAELHTDTKRGRNHGFVYFVYCVLCVLCVLCTVYFVYFVYFVYCVLCAVCTLCSLYFVYCVLCVLCTLCTLYFVYFVYCVLCVLCTVCTLCTLYFVYCVLCVLLHSRLEDKRFYAKWPQACPKFNLLLTSSRMTFSPVECLPKIFQLCYTVKEANINFISYIPHDV